MLTLTLVVLHLPGASFVIDSNITPLYPPLVVLGLVFGEYLHVFGLIAGVGALALSRNSRRNPVIWIVTALGLIFLVYVRRELSHGFA